MPLIRWKKGTIPICAKHPPGRSGKWDCPFAQPSPRLANGRGAARIMYYPSVRCFQPTAARRSEPTIVGDRTLPHALRYALTELLPPINGVPPMSDTIESPAIAHHWGDHLRGRKGQPKRRSCPDRRRTRRFEQLEDRSLLSIGGLSRLVLGAAPITSRSCRRCRLLSLATCQ